MDFLHNHNRGFPPSPLDFLLPNHRLSHDWDFFDFDPFESFLNRYHSRQSRHRPERQTERDIHRNRHHHQHHHHHQQHNDRHGHYRDRDGVRDRGDFFPRNYGMDDVRRDIEDALEDLVIGPTFDLRRILQSFGLHDSHRHREDAEETRVHKPRSQRPQEDNKERVQNRNQSKSITCPICLDIAVVSQARTLPCEHTFHKGCISKWQKVSNTCPTCRSPIDE